MRDLGMEAQLQLFAHLRPELQDTQDSESSSSDADLQISDDDEEFFKPAIPRRLTPSNNLHLRTLAVANSFKKISYAERVAKNKLMNSRLTSLRTKKASTSGFEAPERSKVIPKKLMKNTTATSSVAGESAIILKPSWSVSAFSRCVKKSRLQMNPPPLATNEDTPDQDSNSKAILNVQKRSDNVSTAMADHSYTSALWLQNSTNSSTNNNHAAKPMTSSSATSRSSSTLVLCPSGNLTHFTIANMTSAKLLGGSKKGPSVSSSASDPIKSSLARLKMDATGSSSLKPAAHLLSTGVPTSSSETERVLSLCARPLTPESFVPGSVKPAGVISVKRVQSPLSLDPPAEVPSSASSNKIKSQIKQEVKQKEESDVTETKSPLLQPSKIKGSVLPALSSSPTTTSAPVISASRTTHTVSKPISKKSLVPSLNANTFPSLSAPSTATVSAVSCLSNASLTVPSVALSAYGHMIPSTLMQCRSEMMLPHNFSHPLQVASLYPSMLPTVSPHPPMPSTVPFRPPAPHTASSPLIPGRLSLAGKKRSFPPPPATVPLESPPARWSISSGSSPSPMKKTRTLAEIKAQMKAKRAAAASTKPLPPHQPGVVAPNSRTHLFSAPTFPVYFPMVTDGDVSNPINHSQNSLLSNYIRLPTTATLPLEKVQWVSHQMAPSIQASTPSNQLFNHTHVAAALRNPVPTQQPPVVATSSSSTTSSTKQPQPSAQTTKSEGKGKITLKIKAAGSAISLKVDADVIKKELKRSAQSPSSDDDLSSDDSISDESDVDRPRISKHRGPIKLPKVARRSSDSGSDLEKSTERRWAPNAIDTGQPMKKPNAPTLRQTPVTSPILLPKPPPVFGKSPFNVSVKPATTIMDPAVNHFTKNNLFHHKPPLSFSSVPASISWAANKVVSNTSSAMASDPLPTSLYQSSKYRSTSKGKSLQNMQELARTNRIHSDDSAEEDEDSSGDEDPCDSTFSTTTASENDKCSESDDDHPVPTWTGGKASADKVMTINDKRSTRSSNVGNKQKKTGV